MIGRITILSGGVVVALATTAWATTYPVDITINASDYAPVSGTAQLPQTLTSGANTWTGTYDGTWGSGGPGNGMGYGGPYNPEVGVQSGTTAPKIMAVQADKKAYLQYEFNAGSATGLVGATSATFDAVFRIKNANNGGNQGVPLLSLEMNGFAVSLNTAQDSTDGNYHYRLVQWRDDSSPGVVLHDLGVYGYDSGSHEDPNYEHAVLTLTNTGHVTLVWNGGDPPAFDASITSLASTESKAYWGAGTIKQQNPGNATTNVWYQSVRLTASNTPIAPPVYPSLQNGDFENGTSPWMPYTNSSQWMHPPMAQSEAAIAGGDHHPTPSTYSGITALAYWQDDPLDGSHSGAFQQVQVDPNQTYTLSGAVAGGVTIETATGEQVHGVWEVRCLEGLWDLNSIDNNLGNSFVVYSNAIDGAFDGLTDQQFNWTPFSLSYTPSQGVTVVTVFVDYKAWSGDGSTWSRGRFGAYFDNLALTQVLNPCQQRASWADADGDGDVDQDDFAYLQSCYTGPGGTLVDTPGQYPCSCLDKNGDSAIDSHDVADFQNCVAVNGPMIPANCP